MKKRLFLGAFTLLCSMAAQAQYSITRYQSTSTGITENYPADIEYNSLSRVYTSFHSNSVGMSVVNFDAATGTRINSFNFYKSGIGFTPVKILHFGTSTYLLFNYVSGTLTRFGICKYDNTTNLIIWAKGLSTLTMSEIASDMALDASGNVYVTGSYTNTSGDDDIFIANVSATGTILWNNQYVNTTYNESAGNIYYDAANNEFTLGGFACNISNCTTDRYALVWRVNTSGAILASTLINYSTWVGVRMSGICAKRNGAYVYVTANSYVGADGPGPLFVAKLNQATLALNTYKHYVGPTYFNPEFNFTASNTKLILCGSASFVNTATPGLVNTMFDLATCAYTSEARYTTVGSSAWGSAMSNSYNSGTNELGTIATDPLTANKFYFIKSNYNGNTTCDVNLPYTLVNYTMVNNPYSNVISAPVATFPFIKLFASQPMVHEGLKICSYICVGCQLPTNDSDLKSMATADASSQEATVMVYPNPAKDNLTISIDQTDVTVTSVELFDIGGRLVLTKKGLTSNLIDININELDKGLYVVKATLNNGTVDIKRFVKE